MHMRVGLQIAIGLLSLVPAFYGALNWATGTVGMGVEAAPSLDSQFRYLSGIYIGLAVMMWVAIPRVERATVLIRLIALAFVLGGLGRVLS